MHKVRRFRMGRILAAAAAILLLAFVIRSGYSIWVLREEIAAEEVKKQELMKENAELEARKKELQDPAVIERKARDDLGMVKPGELPYVK